MSFHGGLLGVAMACLVFGWRTGAPILRLGDLLACVAPIGLFLGRLANFINGELWGRPTVLPWGVIFPDPRAGAVPRHPSQLYEAALEGFLLFAVLNLLARSSRVRSRADLLTATFLLGYGVARTLVELTREPDASLFGPFTRGQAYSLPMLASGLVLLLLALRSPPDTHRSSPASHAG